MIPNGTPNNHNNIPPNISAPPSNEFAVYPVPKGNALFLGLTEKYQRKEHASTIVLLVHGQFTNTALRPVSHSPDNEVNRPTAELS